MKAKPLISSVASLKAEIKLLRQEKEWLQAECDTKKQNFAACRKGARVLMNERDELRVQLDTALELLREAKYELYKAGQALDFMNDGGGRDRAWKAESLIGTAIVDLEKDRR